MSLLILLRIKTNKITGKRIMYDDRLAIVAALAD